MKYQIMLSVSGVEQMNVFGEYLNFSPTAIHFSVHLEKSTLTAFFLNYVIILSTMLRYNQVIMEIITGEIIFGLNESMEYK